MNKQVNNSQVDQRMNWQLRQSIDMLKYFVAKGYYPVRDAAATLRSLLVPLPVALRVLTRK